MYGIDGSVIPEISVIVEREKKVDIWFGFVIL
jgi:hypothetical protein